MTTVTNIIQFINHGRWETRGTESDNNSFRQTKYENINYINDNNDY